MSEQRNDDDVVLAELAAVLRYETQPPPEVTQAAKELFTWRTVDAELAELAYDSLVDDDPAVVRSAGQPRILSFEAEPVTIEVEVDETPGARRLFGQLVPPSAAALELRTAGGPTAGRADELGRFVLPLPAARQPASLRCMFGDGTTVDSAWLSL